MQTENKQLNVTFNAKKVEEYMTENKDKKEERIIKEQILDAVLGDCSFSMISYSDVYHAMDIYAAQQSAHRLSDEDIENMALVEYPIDMYSPFDDKQSEVDINAIEREVWIKGFKASQNLSPKKEEVNWEDVWNKVYNIDDENYTPDGLKNGLGSNYTLIKK